jgi:hypothetical protein
MKNILFLFISINILAFGADPYKKSAKTAVKIEKLEQKRQYQKALEKSTLLLTDPFATIKTEDRITNFLNHAELLALLHKQQSEYKPFLDSATITASTLSALQREYVTIESAKIMLLALDYLDAGICIDQLEGSKIGQLSCPNKDIIIMPLNSLKKIILGRLNI